jgi:hypothetical protein
MKIATRHKLGWILLGLSITAAVVGPILAGQPVYEHSSEPRAVAIGPVHIITWSSLVVWSLALQFSIPVILCGVAGLVCLLWPTHRPQQ